MSCALLENYIEVCYVRRPRVCCLGGTTTAAAAAKTDENVVSYTAVFSVVTQRFSPPVSGEERCVTTLETTV